MALFCRSSANPLISPENVRASRADLEVAGTFNAGAALHNGETILLLRVSERPADRDDGIIRCPHISETGEFVITEVRRDDRKWDTTDPRKIWHRSDGGLLLTSISHLRLARSTDGVSFSVDDHPWLAPSTEYERFGVEDARITNIDGRYYVNFTAVSPHGIATELVSTDDFVEIRRHGLMFPPANRDVVIFPEKIHGRFFCYHRPMPWGFGGLNIWGASSPDLLCWGDHQIVLAGEARDSRGGRIGGGAPPIRTDRGWLSFYHSADQSNRYCMNAYLTPLDDPYRIIADSTSPVIEPEAPYETDGFFPNVVFACGAIQTGEVVRLYYGAADERIAMAEARIDEVLEVL